MCFILKFDTKIPAIATQTEFIRGMVPVVAVTNLIVTIGFNTIVYLGSVINRAEMNVWWYMALIPALNGQRQPDLCELNAILVYIDSFMLDSLRYNLRPCIKQNKTNKKGFEFLEHQVS